MTSVGTVTPAGTLVWRVHLFRERPARGWMALGIMAGVMSLLHFAGDDAFIPFAFVVFALSLASFFFPTDYELTPDGVTRRVGVFATRRRWDEFPRWFADDEGVKLSVFRARSRREPFRGIWLRFAGNRDEVLAYVASKIGQPATNG